MACLLFIINCTPPQHLRNRFYTASTLKRFGKPGRPGYSQSLLQPFFNSRLRTYIHTYIYPQLIHPLSDNRISTDAMEPDAKKSTINFDRALPALPLKLCLDLPPNISFKPPTRTENPHERLGSSTNSPTSPTSRGRQHFRSITRDLLRSSDPPMPSPISTSGQPGLLDPVKQNLSDNDTQNPNILSGYVLVLQSKTIPSQNQLWQVTHA